MATVNELLLKAELEAKEHLKNGIDNINATVDRQGKIDPNALQRSRDSIAALKQKQDLIDKLKLQKKVEDEQIKKAEQAEKAKSEAGKLNGTTGTVSSGVSTTV